MSVMRKVSMLLMLLLGGFSLAGCSTFSNDETQIQPVRIGVLTVGDSRIAKIEGMRKGMQELGWTDQQVDYRIYNAKEREEKLAEGVRELLSQKPNVLVASGGVEALVIYQEMISMSEKPLIPVVLMGPPGELVLQEKFAEAGILAVGVDNGHVDLTGKRMELLRLLFPDRKKLIVLYDPHVKVSLLALEKARETARLYSYQMEPVPINQNEDIEKLYRRNFSPDESMLILPSYALESKYRELRDLSFQKKVPVMGLYESETLAGFTASYGISYFDQGYQSARLVARAAESKSLQNIPMETPDVVQLKLNMKAAEKIGAQFSPAGLSYGEKIYEIRE